MKFTTIVIIEASIPTMTNIKLKILEESKTYPSKEIIKYASLLPEVDVSDKLEVAEALHELTGSKTGVDENGIYLLTTLFKDNLIEQCRIKFDPALKQANFLDDYNIFDLQVTNDLLNNIDNFDRFPDVLFLPNGKLIRAPKAFMNISELSPDYSAFIDWQNDVKTILRQYSLNSFSLILDCHI